MEWGGMGGGWRKGGGREAQSTFIFPRRALPLNKLNDL